ncbi:HPr family phosphocarrier protein [Paenarthrobacter sp. PH39-S1]|uniref:HPr family phosphocarrier protein n=1 Tax=Micrococcaceae TaxID=1268 RepID=UPI0024B884CC|nr:HPr family phosphocarrier protein [Paenarthrobacter sp. PH39-S1]MDJ0357470.1 HPr family phosphocarrier protein [Paenarthrobacter sp. PH39-S1]
MYIRNATVTAAIGLHARPAAVFVRAVTRTGLPVTLAKPGQPAVDATSLLQVMTADFGCGCEVVLSVPDIGHDDLAVRTALDALADLLSTDLVHGPD